MDTLQIYLKQLKDYGNITKTQRIQTEMPLRDLETLIDTRMDNNVISHVHSNLVFANVTVFLFLLSDMTNVKNGYMILLIIIFETMNKTSIFVEWIHYRYI